MDKMVVQLHDNMREHRAETSDIWMLDKCADCRKLRLMFE